MAGKRTASKQLNHENWDDEDETEEAGEFKMAPQDVLKNRVIKSAKRRTIQSEDNQNSTNVFSNFTGFAKAPTNTGPLFNFLSKSNTETNLTGIKNGVTSKEEQPKPTTAPETKSENKKSTEYYAKLKGLNESVSKWIKSHVDEDPLCILTPVFKDYEKYLKEIEDSEKNKASSKTDEPTKTETPSQNLEKKEDKKENSESTTSKPMFAFGNTEVKSSPIFSFGIQKTSPESGTLNTSKTSESTSFSFGAKTEEKKTIESTTTPFVVPFSNTAAFSFGNTSQTTTANTTAPFSFGSGKPFSFAPTSVSAPQTENKKPDDEEESDEPPKVEFVPVVEEGSIYNVKCKLFAKKDNNFVERGVGQLYLKPVKDTDKTQLIIRADTNLGNLLMNVVLSKSIPISRKGKNHIMIICIPTPEEAPKPKAGEEEKSPLQTMLIKVKTAEDADKLFEMLEKHKK